MTKSAWAGLVLALGACEGPAGPPGEAAGFEALVESSRVCVAESGDLVLAHRVTRFADGLVIAHCEVTTPRDTTSNSAVWLESQEGSEDAACFLVLDVDEPSRGVWLFEVDGDESIALYMDSESESDGREFVLDTCEGVP